MKNSNNNTNTIKNNKITRIPRITITARALIARRPTTMISRKTRIARITIITRVTTITLITIISNITRLTSITIITIITRTTRITIVTRNQ